MRTSGFGRAFTVMAAALAAGAILPAGAAHAADPGPGTISGRFTTASGGSVTVNLWTTAGGSAGQVISDAEGNYTFPAVAPGQYKVQFGVGSGSFARWQWAYQKLGFSAATVIDVAPGATTEVDDTAIDPGGVQFVVTDAETGEPVDNVCWSRNQYFASDCGATNGVLTATGLPDGTHTLYLTAPDGLHAATSVPDITVRYGVMTRVAVAMTPTAAITTTVIDRATGEPVPDVCVAALPVVFGSTDDYACELGQNESGPDGTVTIGGLAPGEYTLFAVPGRSPYGIQWVGAKGGTGSQYKAKRINVATGRSVAAPAVRLDPAASISGTVTDAETGEPLVNGCASVLPYLPGSGALVYPSCAGYDEPGNYRIDNLGPYDWPLQFFNFYDSDGYGAVWSGDATDRKAAGLIRAGVDQPGVADVALRKAGPGLTISPRTADGQPFYGGLSVDVFNARTGDLVQRLYSGNTVEGVADQPVRLSYYAGDEYGSGWYGGTNFATAKNARVRPADPTTVKLILLERA
jgi:hypothetical protein